MYTTSKERDINAYGKNVYALMRDIFGFSQSELVDQNQHWNAWINEEKRLARSLIELLNLDVRDWYKARALVILLAPGNILQTPFVDTGNRELTGTTFPIKGLCFRDFSSLLLRFTAKLILLNVNTCKESKSQYSWPTARKYKHAILGILSCMRENRNLESKLFNLYTELSLPSPENLHRDDFLSRILRSGIPEFWKYTAAAYVQEMVLNEQDTLEKGQVKHAEILAHYWGEIQLHLYGDGPPPLSVELFAELLTFAMEQPCAGEFLQYYIRVTLILDRLVGEQQGETRYAFARFITGENPLGTPILKANKSDSLKWAQLLRSQFSERDPGLGEKLDTIISMGEKELQRSKDLKLESEQKELALLNRLKA